MGPNPRLLRIAAIAALTAVTTLVVHLLPGLWADRESFEARLDLRTNPIYMARLWIVLLHCVLVVVSMYGARTLAESSRSNLCNLGLLAFIVFAYTEILRTSLGIFALNRAWRANYAAAADAAARERARALIDGFSGINDALFFIFFAAFFLGTLCYGLTFCRADGLSRGDRMAPARLGRIERARPRGCVSRHRDARALLRLGRAVFSIPPRAAIGVWLWREGSLESGVDSAKGGARPWSR